jgi:predicted phage tail component-like protein
LLFNNIDPRAVAQGIISIKATVDDAMPAKNLNMVQLWRGAGYAGFTYGPRDIMVSVNIGSRTRPKALEVARRLVGWAASDSPCPLVLNHEPDKFYLAVCSACTPKTLRNTFLVLDFAFTAPDPRAFTMEERSASLEETFIIEGTAWTYPIITHTLAAQASGVRYTLDNGQYVELVGTLPTGSVIQIDHAARTVRVSNLLRPALLDYVHSRWFELSPGEHTITASVPGVATVTWRDTWL